MRFTKMHGIGNDYVYINGFVEKVADPANVARKVSDRHYGIGGDGLILILPSQRADVRMQMFNADGSEGEMCGNGVRCVAKYAYEHGLSKNNPMRVETGRGVLSLDLKIIDNHVEMVTVNMGEPILDLPAIPFDSEKAVKGTRAHEYRLSIAAENVAHDMGFQPMQHGSGDPCHKIDLVPVSMGNPHAVMYVEDVAKIELERIGPIIEHHPAFPKRVNAHWVQVISRNELQMRTWERGSGITWACGTGASAVGVAGVLTGRNEREVLIHLPGGDLKIEWREKDNCVYMTGPATEVFGGDWEG